MANFLQNVTIKKPKFSTFNLSHNSIDTYNIGDLNVGYATLMMPGEIVNYRSRILGKFSPLQSPAYAHMKLKEYAFFVPIQQIDHNFSEFIMNTKKQSKTYVENGQSVSSNYQYASSLSLTFFNLYTAQNTHIETYNEASNYDRSASCTYLDRHYVSRLANQLGVPRHLTIPCYYDGGVSDGTGIQPVKSRNLLMYENQIGASIGSKVTFNQNPYTSPDLLTNNTWRVYYKYLDDDTRNYLMIDINLFRAYQHIYNSYFRDSRLQDVVDLYPDYFSSTSFNSASNAISPLDFNRLMWNLCRMRRKSYSKDMFNTASTDPTLGASAMSVGNTILDFRKNNAFQKFLEKKALGGSRYADYLLMYFGVTANDYDVDLPVYLGMSDQSVGISELLQTSQTTSSSSDPSVLGDRAGEANVYNANKGYQFRAPDYGYFMTIVVLEPSIAYYEGINRKLIKRDWADYPIPEFSQIGMQAIDPYELYVPYKASGHQQPQFGGTSFGYAPRYYEWKHEPDRVQGDFATTLHYWHQNPSRSFSPLSISAELMYLNRYFPEVGFGDMSSINSLVDTTGTWRLYGNQQMRQFYNNIFSVQDNLLSDHAQMSLNHNITMRRCLPANDMPQL